MHRITSDMTILEVLCQFRRTEQVFRRYDAGVGVCLCCQALFDSLEEVAQKYGLDLNRLLADLEQAAGAPPTDGKKTSTPKEQPERWGERRKRENV
jgi:iron-sulfur cluster repair protein YtfE (RIC family)